MSKLKHLTLGVTNVKMDGNGRTFTCYGNVKGNIDHALDRTMNGAYIKSIAEHKAAGTMPKMFFMHNGQGYQVGIWFDMEEDQKGLKMTGELLDTEEGEKIYKAIKLAEKHGVKCTYEFSIGYTVIEEKWNSEGYNELIEIKLHEVSWVNWGCNPLSTLEAIKTHMEDGELPTKRELEKLLHEVGLPRRKAKAIADQYEPPGEPDRIDVVALLDEFEGKFII